MMQPRTRATLTDSDRCGATCGSPRAQKSVAAIASTKTTKAPKRLGLVTGGAKGGRGDAAWLSASVGCKGRASGCRVPRTPLELPPWPNEEGSGAERDQISEGVVDSERDRVASDELMKENDRPERDQVADAKANSKTVEALPEREVWTNGFDDLVTARPL